MRRTPLLIVGGGPAGAAAAIVLARAGRPPELVERSAGPHDKVCGGFLGWDALAALERLGLDPAALGARPIRRLRLAAREGVVEARLPHMAAGLSRRTLDAALLDAAEAAGAKVTRGRAARAADAETCRVRFEDGGEVEADTLLLATGKHELRGLARPADIAAAPLGLRAAFAGTGAVEKALDGVIELHLFDGGYGGLLLQEDGSVNLCLSVSRARLSAAGGVEPLVDELAAELPLLARRIGDAAPEWLAVAGVPYGWRARATSPGIYRVGDQAAVIASLAGDGVAVALESGIAAAEAILSGRDAAAQQKRFAARARRPLAVAEALRHAAERHSLRTPLLGLLRLAPGLARLGARLTRI